MPRPKVIPNLVVVGLLALVALWLWRTPLARVPSKAAIGKLNLEDRGAELEVRFIPPKSLHDITLLLPKSMSGSQDFCTHPYFPLSVRVRVMETDGTKVIDDLITCDRMIWTSWHSGPSLVLNLRGLLGEYLNPDREYDLFLSVDSAVADLGYAEVFLHWADGGYIWGRKEQQLEFTTRSSKSPLR